MVMSVEATTEGGARAFQSLVSPVIYLDHWAVRLFAEDLQLQDRLIQSLHAAGGTLLFTLQNLFEFAAMRDVGQAVDAEALLNRAIPHLYVADSFVDLGFFQPEGTTLGEEHEKHVLLKLLIKRAEAGPRLSATGLIATVVENGARLAHVYAQMTSSVAQKMMQVREDEALTSKARSYRPAPGRSLAGMLIAEMARDTHLGTGTFTANDTADWIHAVPAAVLCDLVLLDARWRDKLEKATRRIRSAGVNDRLARPFSRPGIGDFLRTLEEWN